MENSGTESAPKPRRRWKFLLLGLVVVPAVLSGTVLGYGLKFDLPDVRKLEDYTPPLSTRVFAADGTPLASFGEQRRILVGYGEIPKTFEQALVAVEDSSYYHHHGIDLRGILRAAWHDVSTFRLEQGASTLTQQLARNLFLKPDKTLRRKLQEMLLAMEIERRYSKQEILRLYCNQVYMGHGRYGLEAAARFYFGGPARDLDLAQSALLAGIVQRPEALSPLRNPDRAVKRRNHVLLRMVEEHYITRDQARAAQKTPLVIAAATEAADLAPYFAEEVRRNLQAKYGDDGVYRGGLEVRTTLDPKLQAIANRALDLGLRELDKRQGWRGVGSRVPEGADPDTWSPPSWKGALAPGVVTEAVVTLSAPGRARVRVREFEGYLGPKEIAWTGRTYPSAILKRGDIVWVRVISMTPEGRVEVVLEQRPRAEAALVALDPRTGEIRALVGGFDFRKSEFDRAIQARRQCGSAFKPFVYAAALMRGMTASKILIDEPTVFVDRTTFQPYQPENYGDKYYGAVTLRHALEKSINIATVKLLNDIGFESVIEMARRLGIRADLRPYPSMALGAFEVTLVEITSAYGTLANQGVHVAPHLIREVLASDGTALEQAEPEIVDAVTPQIAFVMNRLLEGVVTDGTGAAAAELGRPLAGKTGTTDDFTDAWFIGYAPDLVVGVWVGFDEKKSLVRRETGAQAALPIWKVFMEDAYAGRPPEDFPVPEGVSIIAIDGRTGLKASEAAGCDPVLSEAFLEGTEPTAYCSRAQHDWIRLPYAAQHYPLNEDGEITIPEGDIHRLLARDPSLRLVGGGSRLEALGPGGRVDLPVHRVPGGHADTIPADLAGRIDPASFVGKDGRSAAIALVGPPPPSPAP
jgi:penicillin-binding protein 1A